MPHILDLPTDVLMEIPWDFEDLLSVVLTCRSLNLLFTPKIYEVVEYEGGFDDESESDSFLSFLRTIAARPDLGQLVHELSLSGWYAHLENSETIAKEIITVSGREVEDGWPNSVAETLGRLMLSRLTELQKLFIDYPGDVDLLGGCLFHKLVDVSIYADEGTEGEDRTEHFEDAARLLSLPHLRTFSVHCALIDNTDILEMLPPDSSAVQDITIASRNISKKSLQLLLAIPKSLKRFQWRDRMWVCHTQPEEIACVTTSSVEIAQCLSQVKNSLEELEILHAFIKMCPHDTGVLDSLREFPKLTAMTLTPQMLLGWHNSLTVTESSHLASLGPMSSLLPKSLVEIRLQALAEGEILEWIIESLARNSDLPVLKVIEVKSISAFDRVLAPEYAFGARYPLRPLSFKTYMRLYKECQAAGIALQNYEFDYQRERIVEAGAFENPQLWDDEKFRYSTLLQAVFARPVPWNNGGSGLDESDEPSTSVPTLG